MSGKSQTIGYFVVSRPSQTFPTYENTKSWMSGDRLGWSGIDRENRNCFYSPDLFPFNPDDRGANVFVFSY